MRRSNISPFGAVLRGAVAGAGGTIAMDLIWFQRNRREGNRDRFVAWESSANVQGWDEAGAPAQVGKRFVEGFLGRKLPDDKARITDVVMHWGTGIAWGAVFGVVAGSLRSTRMRHGVLFAPAVWAAPYLLLARTGIYKPMSEYDAQTLWKDFTAHLVYGAGLGWTFRLLSSRS